MGLPDNLIEQYRTVALERLDRIESGWEQVIATLDVVAAEALHRELHTLKGESRLVGFLDVDTVCHKLEDLLDVARGRGYAVDEDFDLAVNMAVRFMVMLVRKRVGTALGGFDLPGFVRHIDQLVGEARRDSSGKIRRAGSLTPLNKVNPAAQVSTAMRERLGPAGDGGRWRRTHARSTATSVAVATRGASIGRTRRDARSAPVAGGDQVNSTRRLEAFPRRGVHPSVGTFVPRCRHAACRSRAGHSLPSSCSPPPRPQRAQLPTHLPTTAASRHTKTTTR